jgi:hypothetical protein
LLLTESGLRKAEIYYELIMTLNFNI